MIPKHKNPTRQAPRRHSVAPYNFVPLPDAIGLNEAPPEQDRYQDGLLSGKFTCTLTNQSPLYVRAFQTLQEFEDGITPVSHTYGEKFSDLIIPGSSIRGMLRNMVEIISYSKLAPITDQRLFYRTVDDTSVGISYRKRMLDRVRGGFFRQDRSGAWIEPCVVVRVLIEDLIEIFPDGYYNGRGPNRTPKPEIQHTTVFVETPNQSIQNSEKIYTTDWIALENDGNLSKGVLVLTGPLETNNSDTSKRHEFVFIPQVVKKEDRIDLDPELVDRFQDDDQITRWQKNAFNGRGRQRPGWLKDNEPVFFLYDSLEKQVEFFGRAYMFRLPYNHSPADMIPVSLKPENGVDLAESLFGMVQSGKNERQPIAGRVFICDAKFEGDFNNALFEDGPVIISSQSLSTPKPTSIQHYLTQRYPDHKNKLDHYDNNPESESVVRGHKLYWHHNRNLVSKNDVESRCDPPRNQEDRNEFHPVRSGQKFSFDIHFENIRPVEMGAILQVLDIASDLNFCLKLGMAKPLGLGSVNVAVSKHELIERKKRYSNIFSGSGWNTGIMQKEQAEEDLNAARKAFHEWLLGNEGINPRKNIKKFEDLDRIKDLLAMLSSHGLDDQQTRYMTFQEFAGRGNTGFDKRAVLPTPQAVKNNTLPDLSPTSPTDPVETEEPEYLNIDTSETLEIWRGFWNKPGIPEIGEERECSIIDVDKIGDIYLDFGEIDQGNEKREILGLIKKERIGDLIIVDGDAITVHVLAIVEGKDDIVIECEPVH